MFIVLRVPFGENVVEARLRRVENDDATASLPQTKLRLVVDGKVSLFPGSKECLHPDLMSVRPLFRRRLPVVFLVAVYADCILIDTKLLTLGLLADISTSRSSKTVKRRLKRRRECRLSGLDPFVRSKMC